MNTFVLLGLLVAALGAVSASAAESPVTLRGYAGIVPGMSASEVGARLGEDLQLDTLPGSPCTTAGIRVGPVRGYALFIDGKLGSLWFRRGVQTDRGIRIGSTATELSRAYPKTRTRPDHYVPGARKSSSGAPLRPAGACASTSPRRAR